ncbi:CENPK protein, partial [Atlantisia rogersi]|nr:CENPK protein [Atlantisia rogersi]
LQKVKSDLEMLLSAVQSKNKRLEEDLKREQQWYKEQEQILHILNKIEEEAKKQVNHRSNKRYFFTLELKNETLRVNFFKEHLLNDLCGFLEEHFPLPEKGGIAEKKKVRFFLTVKFGILTLLVFQTLMDKIISTPHEPYVAIRESFWPPYIEMLLRSGIALRHPEDPNRIRLEAFHM